MSDVLNDKDWPLSFLKSVESHRLYAITQLKNVSELVQYPNLPILPDESLEARRKIGNSA
jgi:hypothetical protein